MTCFYDQVDQLGKTRLKNESLAKDKYDFKAKFLKDKYKLLIEQTIKRNFSSESTKVYFSGFKNCSQAPNADLIVMKAASKIFILNSVPFRGRAVIGEDSVFERDDFGNELGFFKKSGYRPFIALKAVKNSTIVHEFGHVLGLRHEHAHRDSELDANCNKRGVPAQGPDREVFHSSTHTVTEYDSESIMNYCYAFSNRRMLDKSKGSILSKKDLETLLWAYR